MKRLILALPLCLVALGLAPVPAAADPVALTSGNIFYHVGDPLFVTLPVDRGFHRRSRSSVSPSWACSPCAPGDMLNTSVSEDFSTLGAVGSFVFEGTTYKVIDSGSFTINSGDGVGAHSPVRARDLIRIGLHPVYVRRHTNRSLVWWSDDIARAEWRRHRRAHVQPVCGGQSAVLQRQLRLRKRRGGAGTIDAAAGRCSRGRCRGAAPSGQAGRRVAFT